MKRRRVVSAVLTGLALLALACSGGDDSLAARETRFRIDPSFVGRIDGTDAFIGIGQAAGGSQVIAFLSDGEPSEVGKKGAAGEWFVGGAGEEIDLMSRNGVRLQGRIEGDVARGTLSFQGGWARDFTAEKARGDKAGLYREEASVGDVAYLLGWVVLNDGKERGSSYPPFIRCSGGLAAPLLGRICP